MRCGNSRERVHWKTRVLLWTPPTNISYWPKLPEWQCLLTTTVLEKWKNKTVDTGSEKRANNTVEVMESAAGLRHSMAANFVWEIHWQVMNNEIHGRMGETASLPWCSHPCSCITFGICIKLEECWKKWWELPCCWQSLIFCIHSCKID